MLSSFVWVYLQSIIIVHYCVHNVYSRLLRLIKNILFPQAQISNSAYDFMWIHWYMDKPMELLKATLAYFQQNVIIYRLYM